MFGIRFWFKFLTGFWHLVQLGSLLSIKLILEGSLTSPYSKIQSSLYHVNGQSITGVDRFKDPGSGLRTRLKRGLTALRLRTYSHAEQIAVWYHIYLTSIKFIERVTSPISNISFPVLPTVVFRIRYQYVKKTNCVRITVRMTKRLLLLFMSMI